MNAKRGKNRSTRNDMGRSPRTRTQENITAEGIYSNGEFMHNLTSQVGNTTRVFTQNGASYEGVFKTFSSSFEVVLEMAHKVDANVPSTIIADSVIEKMIFKPQDIVFMEFKNSEADYATKDTFQTDTAISKFNGELREVKKLEPWDGSGTNGDEFELDGNDAPNGWDVNDMFRTNEQDYGVKSTFDHGLAGYTTQLHSADTDDFKDAQARASKIAQEIENNPTSKSRIDLENGDEEERYAAVCRPHSSNSSNASTDSSAKYYVCPPKRKTIQSSKVRPMNPISNEKLERPERLERSDRPPSHSKYSSNSPYPSTHHSHSNKDRLNGISDPKPPRNIVNRHQRNTTNENSRYNGNSNINNDNSRYSNSNNNMHSLNVETTKIVSAQHHISHNERVVTSSQHSHNVNVGQSHPAHISSNHNISNSSSGQSINSVHNHSSHSAGQTHISNSGHSSHVHSPHNINSAPQLQNQHINPNQSRPSNSVSPNTVHLNSSSSHTPHIVSGHSHSAQTGNGHGHTHHNSSASISSEQISHIVPPLHHHSHRKAAAAVQSQVIQPTPSDIDHGMQQQQQLQLHHQQQQQQQIQQQLHQQQQQYQQHQQQIQVQPQQQQPPTQPQQQTLGIPQKKSSRGKDVIELRRFSSEFKLGESQEKTQKMSPPLPSTPVEHNVKPVPIEQKQPVSSDNIKESQKLDSSPPQSQSPSSTTKTPAQTELETKVLQSKLNPNAKEFVYNPSAKPFNPRSQNTTPSRPHTPQTPSYPGPPQQQQTPTVAALPPTMLMPYMVASQPQYSQGTSPGTRFRKMPMGMSQCPDIASHQMQVAAATGQPLLAQSAPMHTQFAVPYSPHQAAHLTPQPYQPMVHMIAAQPGSGMVPLVPVNYQTESGQPQIQYVTHSSIAAAAHHQHMHAAGNAGSPQQPNGGGQQMNSNSQSNVSGNSSGQGPSYHHGNHSPASYAPQQQGQNSGGPPNGHSTATFPLMCPIMPAPGPPPPHHMLTAVHHPGGAPPTGHHQPIQLIIPQPPQHNQ